jgi:hypothetical protein
MPRVRTDIDGREAESADEIAYERRAQAKSLFRSEAEVSRGGARHKQVSVPESLAENERMHVRESERLVCRWAEPDGPAGD